MVKRSIVTAGLAILVVPALLAQEPALQFGVRYQCPATGHTIIISRCTPAGRGEFCFYEEIRGDGVSLGEGYGTRPQIELRVKPCQAQKATAAPTQTVFDPPYLKEMPPVERVMKEITGSDALDTTARQAGALWDLQKFIYDFALAARRNRNSLKPDEQRLVNMYGSAYGTLVAQIDKALSAPTDRKRFSDLMGYATDDKLQAEVLKRFFSPAFTAAYLQLDQVFAQRHQEFLNAQAAAEKAADAEAAAAAQKGAHERAVAKCIASGRNPLTCTGDAFSSALVELMGGSSPLVSKAAVPGLRLNGIYRRPGFNVQFVNDAAVLDCGALVPESHDYRVEQKNATVVVTIAAQPAPITFTYFPATKVITGPATADVTGKVAVGTRTLTRYDSTGLGTPVSTEPVYEIRTEHCTIGSMPSTGPAVAANLGNIPLLGALAGQMEGVREFKTVAGLRMNGLYGAPTGANVEFSSDQSVMLGCGDLVVARDYTVELRAGVIVVSIQNGAQVITLTVQPDGSLAGSGTMDVAGRILTGKDQSGNLTFASRNVRCALGTLAPAR